MMITKRLLVFTTLVLGAAFSLAGEQDLTEVSRLKADLDAVVQLGEVRPVDGVTTSGQPDEAAFRVFAERGYAAVIDLRAKGENRGLDEPAVVEALGMDYISLPVKGLDGISFANAKVLNRLINSYSEPVLVHCGSSNRVGALLALQTYSDTGDAELALETGKAGGLASLEGKVRELMGVE